MRFYVIDPFTGQTFDFAVCRVLTPTKRQMSHENNEKMHVEMWLQLNGFDPVFIFKLLKLKIRHLTLIAAV